MSAAETPRICVVGACNLDLISYVPRMPALGETIHGTAFRMGYGGKGANQAVMAAKLGAQVSMVSKLGDDPFGPGTLDNLRGFGIDTAHVGVTDQAFSGVAPITVDPAGSNSIIIVTGANDLMTVNEIEAARETIRSSQVMVCQLEIPLPITQRALEVAREEGVFTIMNPAPARETLPDALYALSDVFCPNESETEMLTGMPVTTDAEASAAARELLRRGARSVVLTLGERGALVVTPDGETMVPAQAVDAIDSTGAGDAFVGSLAYLIGCGMDLDEAVGRACQVATMSVLKQGTQTSFPNRDEVAHILSL